MLQIGKVTPYHFIAIDQGSSATKVLIVDSGTGLIVGRGHAAVADLRAVSITSSVKNAVIQAFRNVSKTASSGGRRTQSCVIGIASQRSTLCFFKADGTPSGTVIPWWDRSGLSERDVTRREAADFRRATGLPLLPNWWAGKLARNIGRTKGHLPGTVDTLLIVWLTGGAVYRTDLSNAARTGLVDLRTRRRSDDLLKLFGLMGRDTGGGTQGAGHRGRDLPASRFPLPASRATRLAEVTPSLFDHGPAHCRFGEVDRTRMPLDGKIVAVLGDAGAGLLGSTGGERGLLNMTLGTGGFLHFPVSRYVVPPTGLYLAPAWHARGRIRWTLEAAVPGMARALRAGLAAANIPEKGYQKIRPRISINNRLRALLAPEGLGALGPKGVEFFEGFEGVRLDGPWSSASAEEKLGALYESLAFLLARAVARFPVHPRLITAGGGLSREPFLLQRVADLTGVPVAPLNEAETTAWGAAMLAARAMGIKLEPASRGKSLLPAISASERKRLMSDYERRLVAIFRK